MMIIIYIFLFFIILFHLCKLSTNSDYDLLNVIPLTLSCFYYAGSGTFIGSNYHISFAYSYIVLSLLNLNDLIEFNILHFAHSAGLRYNSSTYINI